MKKRIPALLLSVCLILSAVLPVLLLVPPAQTDSAPAAAAENYSVPPIEKRIDLTPAKKAPAVQIWRAAPSYNRGCRIVRKNPSQKNTNIFQKNFQQP